MNLPYRIKIGPHWFYLNERNEAWRNDQDAQGKCNTDTFQIDVVTAGRATSHIVDTLLHEIGHAIWWMMNLGELEHVPADEREETVIHRLHTGWTMVWLDNPSFQDWMNAAAESHHG